MHTTLGIAFHNCFEGVAVSVSVFAATKSRSKAMLSAFVSGISEPLAVIFGYGLFGEVLNPKLVSFSMASVSGLMTAVCLCELLPPASKGSTDWDKWLCFGMLLACFPSLIF